MNVLRSSEMTFLVAFNSSIIAESMASSSFKRFSKSSVSLRSASISNKILSLSALVKTERDNLRM